MAETSTDNKVETATSSENKKSDLMLKVTTLVVAVALIAVVALLWMNFRKDSRSVGNIALENSEDGRVLGARTQDQNYLENLALALKTQGFILYGSNNDSDAKRQKEIFGQGFLNLDYVECDSGIENSNSEECAAKGIDKYPTWILGDKKFPGYKSLSELENLLASNQQ